MTRRPVGTLTAVCALVAAGACEPWPRDPEGTFDRAAGGVLRVGATDAPPWIERAPDGSAHGPEAVLVQEFADSIGARIEWRWGSVDEHLEALERHELDLVAAGLLGSSPWSKRVGMTRPWLEEGDRKRVLAVPPGENRTLVALERLLEARKAGR